MPGTYCRPVEGGEVHEVKDMKFSSSITSSQAPEPTVEEGKVQEVLNTSSQAPVTAVE